MPQPLTARVGTGADATPADAVQVLMASRERFLGFLTRRVGNREAAEEILQAAYLKGLEKSALIQDHERVVAWFYRILRNAVIDHYRRRDAEARAFGALIRQQGAQAEPDPEMERAICACLNDILPTLKTGYAEVLRRVDLEEGALKEVSEQMGITVNNATVRLHRARTALRKRLGEVCGACTEHGCLNCTCKDERRLPSFR